MSTRRIINILAFLLSPALHSAHAQQPAPALALPIDAIHAIAADIDEGRSPVYCYHGRRIDGPPLVIAIDSVTLVGSQRECAGLGIAFVMRTDDRELLAAAVRGVIDHNPGFTVVSVFYRTEDIDQHGLPLHAPRALSVVRGAIVAVKSTGP